VSSPIRPGLQPTGHGDLPRTVTRQSHGPRPGGPVWSQRGLAGPAAQHVHAAWSPCISHTWWHGCRWLAAAHPTVWSCRGERGGSGDHIGGGDADGDASEMHVHNEVVRRRRNGGVRSSTTRSSTQRWLAEAYRTRRRMRMRRRGVNSRRGAREGGAH
jgi:hypothetical protein